MLAHIKQSGEIVDVSQHMGRIQKAKSTQNHASMDPEIKTRSHINIQVFKQGTLGITMHEGANHENEKDNTKYIRYPGHNKFRKIKIFIILP